MHPQDGRETKDLPLEKVITSIVNHCIIDSKHTRCLPCYMAHWVAGYRPLDYISKSPSRLGNSTGFINRPTQNTEKIREQLRESTGQETPQSDKAHLPRKWSRWGGAWNCWRSACSAIPGKESGRHKENIKGEWSEQDITGRYYHFQKESYQFGRKR